MDHGNSIRSLQRMLIKGWVTAEWDQSDNNRRARYYRLTPAGRKQLDAEISEFEKVMRAIARVIQTA
ncbi:MAG: helix-turn-helix transcriptional regulator [Thermoguttaceae bacterium]|nr:helix-turn-helix transcriptional regulator [Thermoguttaceae bacterium]